MSSTYSNSLRVELIGSGDQAGTWGTTTDNNFAYIFDSAIAGINTVTVTSANQALTYINGPTSTAALNQSIYAILKFNSAAAASAIYAPPVSKQYIIWNNSSFTITIYNSTVIGNTTAAGAGVAIAANGKVMVWSDGASFYDVQTQSFTGVLPVVNGGTGVTTSTGTGSNVLSASPTLTGTAGFANITASGTLTVTGAGSIQGLTVGRGASAVATNTALGTSTLGAVTSATDCTAVGASALTANTSGLRNTAVGSRALITNTSGVNNVAVGVSALETNSSGNSNIAIGRSALFDNDTGESNVALGTTALANNISGAHNLAVGRDSLFTNTTSTGNIGIGFAAMFTSNSGISNVAIGGSSLYSNTSGFNNVAVGVDAMFTNTTGDGCVAIGHNALKLNLSGDENVAVGFEALKTNSTGVSNTATGYQALIASTSSNNVAVGHIALVGCTSGGSNTGIGKSALGNLTTGSGNTGINPMNSSNTYAPVFDVTTENNRFVAGSTAVTNAYVQVAWTVVSDARDKTDFAPVPHGLDFVTKLKPTTYRYKANRSDTEGHGPLRYGFKAQDVLELEGDNPIIVDTEDLEKLKLNDQSMIAVLVKAIQELKAELDAYKANQESQT